MSSLAVPCFVPVFLAVFAEKIHFVLVEINTLVPTVRSTEGFESKDTWRKVWQYHPNERYIVLDCYINRGLWKGAHIQDSEFILK